MLKVTDRPARGAWHCMSLSCDANVWHMLYNAALWVLWISVGLHNERCWQRRTGLFSS